MMFTPVYYTPLPSPDPPPILSGCFGLPGVGCDARKCRAKPEGTILEDVNKTSGTTSPEKGSLKSRGDSAPRPPLRQPSVSP